MPLKLLNRSHSCSVTLRGVFFVVLQALN